MSRVKRGPHRKNKRRKILKLSKGYYGKKRNAYRIARQAVERALRFSYRDRRQKKRELRKLWIVRINAASRQNGLSYNRLMGGLRRAGVELNRKVLADIAVHDAEGFAAIVELAKEGLELETPREAPKKAAPKKQETRAAAPAKAAPPKKKAPKKKAEEAPKGKAEKAEKAAPEAKKPAPKKAPAETAETPSKSELQSMTVAELKELAAKRGIAESDIEGTGASGNVVKADWVNALAE
jgi:large subunit ribosomal protein L20